VDRKKGHTSQGFDFFFEMLHFEMAILFRKKWMAPSFSWHLKTPNIDPETLTFQLVSEE